MEKQISSWPRLLRHERELRGWSQERVANAIDINPKTVGRWERGEVKPSPEYRLLLCKLFKKTPEELGLVPSETEDSHEDAGQHVATAPTLSHKPVDAHRVDWGEALHVRHLYGRDQECADLKKWIVDERSSVIALLGTGGIGKTALAAAITDQVQDDFDFVFWRSLQNVSPLDTILQKCILILSREQRIDLPDDVEERISLFIEYLRQYRCLLVFDNLETLLQSGEEAGNWLNGYEGYGRLIKRLGEVDHQSCLLLTSREKPKEVAHAEGSIPRFARSVSQA
jgi:transcriptional regulator with XRE-family HTH domain